MRTSFAILFLAVSVLVGYSFHLIPLKAQVQASDPFPFNNGAVTLSTDLPENDITCRVTGVLNGFVGCARDDQQRQAVRWINLRNVRVITPRER
jgi:hypothetical protein